MKNLLLTLGLLGALGCGSKQNPAGGDTSVGSPAKADGGVPCEAEIARVCPDGMVDSCMNQLTTHHECVAADATAGASCEEEVALECPAGQVDICLARAAHSPSSHLCILE